MAAASTQAPGGTGSPVSLDAGLAGAQQAVIQPAPAGWD